MVVDSPFLSPAFLFAESSFGLVASLAAYELLVGDFVWAQEEEARRASVQSQRGRPSGYQAFDRDGPRATTHPRGGVAQGHRSLSPGGRGRGAGGTTPAGRSAVGGRRGSHGEEPSLLYPSRAAARGGSNLPPRGDARASEEAFYSSSGAGDARYASPGRGSSGDSTRRLFYKAILLALVSRLVLLPVETFCFFQINHNFSDQYISTNFTINSTLFRIILRISQTFPDVAFASALGLLVIFCAQVAFAAMPPLTPESSEAGARGDDDPETIDDGAAETDALLGEGPVNRQGDTGGEGVANKWRRGSKAARTRCARLSRTVLASKRTYAAWNGVVFASYALVFVAALALPDAPPSAHELSLWTLILAMYALLSLALLYVAVLLGGALRPGIARRKDADSLAVRLVGTCALLAVMFVDRAVRFGMVAHRTIVDIESSDQEGERIRISYTRSTIEYAFAESLPVLLILFMMHRKRKEIQNDVLILWSLFGSTGRLTASNSQLDAAAMATPGEGTSGAATRGGGLGSRRFQSYGGARGDLFPPNAGNKPRRNMPRAVSSSGGGARSQHHHESATDALALESGPIAGNLTKGGLKPYMAVRTLATASDER